MEQRFKDGLVVLVQAQVLTPVRSPSRQIKISFSGGYIKGYRVMNSAQGKQPLRQQPNQFGLSVGVALLGCLLFAGTTQAAGISPSAPPPAGQVAVPLNTSGTTQKKTGSLVVRTLCLNAESETDEQNCISSWSASSTYVDLQTTTSDTFTEAITKTNSGYVRIQGSNASVPTVSLNVPTGGTGPKTALYAYGNVADDDAGLFQGRVAIENTTSGSSGRLCLNGTSAAACISAWTDLPTPSILNPLTLQSSGAAIGLDSGNIQISGTYASGTITVGDPSVLSKAYTCGDGICSSNESNTPGTTYCQIDCEPVVTPTSFTATAASDQVTLEVTHAVGTSVLVVRSSQANSTFVPTDGTTYSLGGTSTFAIVFSGCQTITPCTFIDSSYGLVNGTTYYYRAYAANSWPRYSLPAVPFNPDSGMASTGSELGLLPQQRAK